MNEDMLRCLSEIEQAGFERISTKISVLWGEPELVEYLKQLIIVCKDRGSRQGFPPPVMLNLLKIYNHYTSWHDTTVETTGYEVTHYI